jgi:hypothetical protein
VAIDRGRRALEFKAAATRSSAPVVGLRAVGDVELLAGGHVARGGHRVAVPEIVIRHLGALGPAVVRQVDERAHGVLFEATGQYQLVQYVEDKDRDGGRQDRLRVGGARRQAAAAQQHDQRQRARAVGQRGADERPREGAGAHERDAPGQLVQRQARGRRGGGQPAVQRLPLAPLRARELLQVRVLQRRQLGLAPRRRHIDGGGQGGDVRGQRRRRAGAPLVDQTKRELAVPGRRGPGVGRDEVGEGALSGGAEHERRRARHRRHRVALLHRRRRRQAAQTGEGRGRHGAGVQARRLGPGQQRARRAVVERRWRRGAGGGRRGSRRSRRKDDAALGASHGASRRPQRRRARRGRREAVHHFFVSAVQPPDLRL